MATPRNALADAYAAAEKIRNEVPNPSYDLLDVVDLLDHYSKRQPLTLTDEQQKTIKSLLHSQPQPGFVYVEHLLDAALAGDAVLRHAKGGNAHA